MGEELTLFVYNGKPYIFVLVVLFQCLDIFEKFSLCWMHICKTLAFQQKKQNFLNFQGFSKISQMFPLEFIESKFSLLYGRK